MGDPGVSAMQEIELFLREMNAVREHSAAAEETVAVVHVRVFSLGKKLVYPLHFTAILGDVRLHVRVRKFFLQSTSGLEQLGRRGWREARRHGVIQQAAFVP